MVRKKVNSVGLPGYRPRGQRPGCENCGKELAQKVCERRETHTDESGSTHSTWVPEKVEYTGYEGLFCTLKCAAAFAAASYRAGYRRKR